MNTILYIVLFILSIVFVAWAIMALCDYISKKRRDRRQLQEEKAREKERILIRKQRELMLTEAIVFWMEKFAENHSENLTKLLEIKEVLFDEYERLNHTIHVRDMIGTNAGQYFIRDRYIIGGSDYRQLLPFIGNDNIYYVIAISSYADRLTPFKDNQIDLFYDDTFKVELLPYCQDKFVNKKVEPVKYDPIYLPRMAFNKDTWQLVDAYKEVIFYDT